ncbi:MAG: hypothetical protein QM713_13940 [Arachnia sp.]
MSHVVTYLLLIVAGLALIKIIALLRITYLDWTMDASERASAQDIDPSDSNTLVAFYNGYAARRRFLFLDGVSIDFQRRILPPAATHNSRSASSMARMALEQLSSIPVLTTLGCVLIIVESSQYWLGATVGKTQFTISFISVILVLLLQTCSAVTQSIGQLIWRDLTADLIGLKAGVVDPVARMLIRGAAFFGSLVFFYLSAIAGLTWAASRAHAIPSMTPPEPIWYDALACSIDAGYRSLLLILGTDGVDATNSYGRTVVFLISATGAAYLVASLAIIFGYVLHRSTSFDSKLPRPQSDDGPTPDEPVSAPPPTPNTVGSIPHEDSATKNKRPEAIQIAAIAALISGFLAALSAFGATRAWLSGKDRAARATPPAEATMDHHR